MESLLLRLQETYKEIKKDLPGLHHLSFGLSEYPNSAGPHFQGWVHHGKACESFHEVDKLADYVEKYSQPRRRKEILFRRFD